MQVIIKKATGTSQPRRGLRVDISLEAQGTENYQVLAYGADLQLAGVGVGTVTEFRSTQLLVGQPLTLALEYAINPELLRTIETKRAGRDAQVSLRFTVLGASDAGATTMNLRNLHAFGVGGQDPPFKITQQEWADALEAMGYDGYAIFELEFGSLPSRAGFEAVVARLREAQAGLAELRTDDVLTQCRKALEGVNALVAANPSTGKSPISWQLRPDIAQQINLGSPGQAQKPAKSIRIQGMAESLWEFLHIGAHENYRVTGEDARLALWSTLALVDYLVEASTPASPP
ncbi:MAG: hypothetical protein L3J97_07060 [Thermoplasmata archaeon]|nr:hypothetical protein [Thermoplasmata archaeon]